ncbi:hypothetical protein GEMRC1_008028 [Eukaryota sp. GEM-RC1]
MKEHQFLTRSTSRVLSGPRCTSTLSYLPLSFVLSKEHQFLTRSTSRVLSGPRCTSTLSYLPLSFVLSKEHQFLTRSMSRVLSGPRCTSTLSYLPLSFVLSKEHQFLTRSTSRVLSGPRCTSTLSYLPLSFVLSTEHQFLTRSTSRVLSGPRCTSILFVLRSVSGNAATIFKTRMVVLLFICCCFCCDIFASIPISLHVLINQQSSQFCHDLTTDGDIESNPGPPLTDDLRDEQLRPVFAPNVDNIETLEPNVWVNDDVIDLYGDFLTKSSKCCQYFPINDLLGASGVYDFQLLLKKIRIPNNINE